MEQLGGLYTIHLPSWFVQIFCGKSVNFKEKKKKKKKKRKWVPHSGIDPSTFRFLGESVATTLFRLLSDRR